MGSLTQKFKPGPNDVWEEGGKLAREQVASFLLKILS